MMRIIKSDFYRFSKSRLMYGIMAFICLIAIVLTTLMKQDIRLGISVFGDLTAFKGINDVVGIGLRYERSLGLMAAVFISVFIGQEYLWKTWQHEWIVHKSRTAIYLSKAILSVLASTAMFLLYQVTVLSLSGQAQSLYTNEYVVMVVCGLLVYAALGAVICLLSMLIVNSVASIIVCLCYVLFSESVISLLGNISSFSEITSNVGEWIMHHSIFGMSLRASAAVSPEAIVPILLNSMAIIGLSTAIGVMIFRKYEL